MTNCHHPSRFRATRTRRTLQETQWPWFLPATRSEPYAKPGTVLCLIQSRRLDVCCPDFGLIVTPNADNCCALLSNDRFRPNIAPLKFERRRCPRYAAPDRCYSCRIDPTAWTFPLRSGPRCLAMPCPVRRCAPSRSHEAAAQNSPNSPRSRNYAKGCQLCPN